MGYGAYIGFFGTLLLVSGYLASAGPIPEDSLKVWKFKDQLNYKQDPRHGRCMSFDFSNNSTTFNYIEREQDGTLNDVQGTIQDVRIPNSEWFCVEYTLPGESSSQFVWMNRIDGNRHAARASDCAGEAPVPMYRSPMENAMCGKIPSAFLQGQFRFNFTGESDDNSCFSFNLGDNPPSPVKPSDHVPDACFKAWGERNCFPNDLEVEKINSKVADDPDWTCVGLRSPDDFENEYLELWLSSKGQTDQAVVVMGPDRTLCELENPPPPNPQVVNQGAECPTISAVDKQFKQNGACHSFNFTNAPSVDATFQFCRDRNDTWASTKAKCLQGTINHMVEKSSDKYCLDFTWDGDTKNALILENIDSDTGTALYANEECANAPSSDGNKATQGRCEGLPSKLQKLIQFQDFNGRCHSFDFEQDPPAGGQSYSQFGYCNGGPLDTDPQYDNDRNCAGDAVIWTIQSKQISGSNVNWYCINFNVTSISTPGQHLWVDENGEHAVLSSDCLALPVLDFRRSNVTTDGDMCRALPQQLRYQFRFWDRNVGQDYPVCNSFDFSAPLVKADQATGFYEGFDQFVYCRGIGGERNCTLPRDSDYDGMNHASVITFNHDDTNGWSCVEFSSPVADGAIWLSDTGEQAVFKSGASCGSTRPSDVSEWSHLEKGICPIMPEKTRQENQVLQGRCASLDLTGHPGYDDANHDTFEFCTGNGHCNHAKLFNLSDSGDTTCVSFAYETAYGLPDKHRSFIINDDGTSGKLVADCSSKSNIDLTAVTHRMCERLPGEIQKGFFFLQDGTRATVDLSGNPNEQYTKFVFCSNYGSANRVCRCAQLKHVVNPDGGEKNWYCMTFGEFDSAYGIGEEKYLWLNPHYYGWNNGAAQFEEDCSGTPPSPMNSTEVHGDYLVRDTSDIPNVCPPAPSPSPSPGSGGGGGGGGGSGGGSNSSSSVSTAAVAGGVVGGLAGLGLIIGGGIFAKKKLGGKSSAREEVVSSEMPSAVVAGNAAAEGQAENAFTHRRSVDNPVRNIPTE